ncbi:SusD/RagB family nutrient-binding outer membrane lipoprotein [Flavobacterium oreochromis]|uniref:SusD/RagB family nutrient-binding outer membrane lipoprotein n=1 Tax=Flavobacterium oreochromis TaxID=2906078 RepID=UPI00385C651E
MKKHKIIIGIFSIISLFNITSCETFELDKTQDPFNLTPEKSNVDFLFNSIEENFVRQIEGDADYSAGDNWSSGGSTNGDGLSLFGGQLTRIYAMSNTNANSYRSTYQASDSDDEWTNFYTGILLNIRFMNKLAEEQGKYKHIGIGQFIEAYTMTAMVDFYGDIPYSEATLGLSNLNPKLDSGFSIYSKAIELLDKAIINFDKKSTSNPTVEVFYNNNYSNWIKAANTLKMKLYLQTRNVDNNAINKFNNIIASGNYIQNSNEDLVYNWPGKSTSNPDSRHPRYGLNYGSTGASDYMSNWLMGTMSNLSDPRIRYYFYRQRAAVPGQEIPASEQNLACSLQTAPPHYVAGGYTFCNLPNGYWGRDHGDVAGTPPDGFLRTTFGVYPAGGKFDGNNFKDVYDSTKRESIGAQGKGITPILLSSWVHFMKAEVALSQNNTGIAKTEMLTGINESISKVQTFGANDPDLSKDIAFIPTPNSITNYINNIDNAWNNAGITDKWNILAIQQFIANFGNGIETYNYYRRTGYPTTLQPNRDINSGNFVRSLYYPSNAVNNNKNINQKPTQTTTVFWNTNPSPIAN